MNTDRLRQPQAHARAPHTQLDTTEFHDSLFLSLTHTLAHEVRAAVRKLERKEVGKG